jgi:hypothetical protein
LVAVAAAAALLELFAGLFLGAFPLSGRAEAFAFLLYRPWVVLLLAVAVARRDWRRRATAYAAFLLLAGVAESFYMRGLGNPHPWAETLRGWAAGGLVALAADLLLAIAARLGRWQAVAAACALAAVLALPPIGSAHERFVAGPEPAGPAAVRPPVLLMTALPLIWGEGGAFDPNSRPAAVYTDLQREFDLRGIDALDEQSLAGSRILLLIQPRWLAPRELAALDAWVRGGGRALILTDPSLHWHSDLPLGDIRRPPPAGLLGPLLSHWGLALEEGSRGPVRAGFGTGRLLLLESPGRLSSRGPSCSLLAPIHAYCGIGAGRAAILADADMVRDDLWVAPGRGGSSRARRLSDNPLVLADLLDMLAGMKRERRAGEAVWRGREEAPVFTLLAVLLPLAALAAAGAAHLLSRRGRV